MTTAQETMKKTVIKKELDRQLRISKADFIGGGSYGATRIHIKLV